MTRIREQVQSSHRRGHREIPMKMLSRVIGSVALLTSLLATVSAFAAEQITYFHHDAQGSIIAATDEAGSVVWRETYQPYGQRIQNDPTAANNTRWYTGHPQDTETGLIYAGARHYDPVTGRFMGIDPAPVTETDLHSFNRYAYGNNNPYRYVDPNGKWAEDIVLGVPSLVVGGHSLWGNVKSGNWGSAAVDVVGMAADVAAIAAPGIPGGVGLGIKAGREGTEAVGKNVGKEIGILRDAATGKGNFGLGKATAEQADNLGKAWVGDGYRIASDGKSLVSADGLRVYRPPSPKSSPYATTGTQANFERKIEVGGRPISNGHLNIE